ncbi:MAG: TonB family protein [Myxococcales bacterium]|nr:TonB family protein [Myxococcales bacterium]
MYALQDEPEKGHRLPLLAIGAVLAIVVQGGGLWAAHSYEPPQKKEKVVSLVRFEVKKPEPPPPPPPPPPEVKPEPPPPPPPEPPKPKPRPRPKPKPVKPEPLPPPEPAKPPEPQKKKVVPLLTGVTLESTALGSGGMKVQVGNTQMGEVNRQAVDAVIEPATPPEPPAPAEKREPVRKPPRRLREVKPAYPPAARRAGIEGTIVLVVSLDEKGVVTDVQLISGLGYGLDESAVEAVRRWQYAPATVDGKPVKSTRREKVEFILED